MDGGWGRARGTADVAQISVADAREPCGTDPGVPSCDGVLMGTVPVAVLDQDGGGLGASDLSLWLEDLFSNHYLERSDLDGDGSLGPADLSILLAAYFAGGSSQNCATSCP